MLNSPPSWFILSLLDWAMVLLRGTGAGGVVLPIAGLVVMVVCFRPASISARLFTWPCGAAREGGKRLGLREV